MGIDATVNLWHGGGAVVIDTAQRRDPYLRLSGCRHPFRARVATAVLHNHAAPPPYAPSAGTSSFKIHSSATQQKGAIESATFWAIYNRRADGVGIHRLPVLGCSPTDDDVLVSWLCKVYSVALEISSVLVLLYKAQEQRSI